MNKYQASLRGLLLLSNLDKLPLMLRKFMNP